MSRVHAAAGRNSRNAAVPRWPDDGHLRSIEHGARLVLLSRALVLVGGAGHAVAHGRPDPLVDQARSVEKAEIGLHLASQGRVAHEVGRSYGRAGEDPAGTVVAQCQPGRAG